MKRDGDREGPVVTLSLIDGDSLRRSAGSLPTVIRRFRVVAFLDWKRHRDEVNSKYIIQPSHPFYQSICREILNLLIRKD